MMHKKVHLDKFQTYNSTYRLKYNQKNLGHLHVHVTTDIVTLQGRQNRCGGRSLDNFAKNYFFFKLRLYKIEFYNN